MEGVSEVVVGAVECTIGAEGVSGVSPTEDPEEERLDKLDKLGVLLLFCGVESVGRRVRADGQD